jgi:hypothetical protein
MSLDLEYLEPRNLNVPYKRVSYTNELATYAKTPLKPTP